MFNLENEIESGITRYLHLISILNEMTEETMAHFATNKQWYTIAAHVCRRFVNQSLSIATLFSCRYSPSLAVEYGTSDDLSSIYSLIRMQFELHALYHHLFMPCQDIHENVLRFRLWDLENTRYRIRHNPMMAETVAQKIEDEEYENIIIDSIGKISYFQHLPLEKRDWRLKKCQWRFTTQSLATNTWKKPVPYRELILNTGIDELTYNKLYEMLSNHTHPTLHGVYHHTTLNRQHMAEQKFVAISLVGIVTASLIEDFACRFESAKKCLEEHGEKAMEIVRSLTKDSRISRI